MMDKKGEKKMPMKKTEKKVKKQMTSGGYMKM